MRPIWAIQTHSVNQVQADALAEAVRENYGDVQRVIVLPTTGLIVPHDGYITQSLNMIPYGTTKLVELAMCRGWTNVFRNNNFYVSAWNGNRQDMLNNESVSMFADELPEYLKDYPNDRLFFIRPTVGKKLFTGQTATKADILNFVSTEQIGKYQFPPDTGVTISSYKEILSETRWFVVDGKVISGSTYRVRGQSLVVPDNNDNNLKEAQRLADVWLPHPTCVMDLAETPEGIKVVEFNTFNSSGFYNHDIPKIVRAVHEMIRKL